MIAFETLYLIFGSFVIGSGLIMIVTYTLTNPWWRNHIGRMLVTYAAAEVLMSLLLLLAIVDHFSPHWFRGAWFTLQMIVGCTFIFQTVTILRLHREKTRKEKMDACRNDL